MRQLTIGTVARFAGVGVETVRFYERKGLVEKPRKPLSGFRIYDPQTVERIRFIKQAQELGFSLREIAELLELRADRDADCEQVRTRARAKLADVRERMRRLEQIREALETLIGSCPGRGPLENCSILEAMRRVRRSRQEDR